MELRIYKKGTETFLYKLKSMSNNFVLNELKKIRRYYKENAFENCNENLKYSVNNLFSSVFDLNMFNSERTSEAMKTSKNAAKRFCLLSLAHMTSKLTRNSKDYPEDVIYELRDFLDDIGRKAQEIQNIDNATMEPFVDSVKSVFNADKIVTNDSYNKLKYLKETRNLANTCFEKPYYLGSQDVDEKMYKYRDITPGNIKNEDIDTEYNKFLGQINGNMLAIDSFSVNRTALNLLNLINGKDEQDKKEKEDFNRKIPVEFVNGTEIEFDPNNQNNFSSFKK